MMKKKSSFTIITPIPSYIPRQLAIDLLHSHGEIIELNPLILGYEGIKAPRDAPSDEFYSTWYEMTQRIQYVPGVGKIGSGVIKFKGCFHDMPWGLQTHVYAPAGVDLRNKYQICGNQPGEPVEQRELGLGAPPEGLYMREDIEVKCNLTMVGFVKKQTKEASEVLRQRLIKKAELLDSGALQAMMENGRLKTVNPADRSSMRPQSPLSSPKMHYNLPQSPMRSPTFPHSQPGNSYVSPNHSQGANNVVMELPGDFYHTPQSSSHLGPHDHRYSTTSDGSGHSPQPSDSRWSNDYQSSMSSRPSSYASDGGMRSPGIDQKGFASELPTMQETREEHDSARKRLEGEQHHKDRKYRYNPQDYANAYQQYSQPPQYHPYNPQGR